MSSTPLVRNGCVRHLMQRLGNPLSEKKFTEWLMLRLAAVDRVRYMELGVCKVL